MKKLALAAALVATLVAPAALACDGDKKNANVRNVTVNELASLNKESKAVVLDANSPEFRAKNGVIPGARLLTNYKKYDIAKELPEQKDTKLVFYCANTQCSASQAAASKAAHAGYSDVNVLSDGMLGWKEAGMPTTPSPRS